MALKIKDVASSAAKFVQRAQAAGSDYQKGTAAAGDLWQSRTSQAQDAYNQGVNDAITRNAFSKGVLRATGAKYSSNASGKGAQRYGPGVSIAGPSWQSGFQPYADAMSQLNLPPRSPRGSPNNLVRVQMVMDLNRKVKLSR